MLQRFFTLFRYIQTYKNWFSCLLYRLNIRPQPLVLMPRSGGYILLRDRRTERADGYVVNEQYLYGIHDGLLPHIKKAKIGIDIGAHIGSFSVFAAGASSATIYAFEPFPQNQAMLQANSTINGYQKQIIPIQKAVAAKEGSLELYTTYDSALISSFKDHAPKYGGTVQGSFSVQATTLEAFFKEKNIEFCDFIKVDCEGCEYEIFLNLPEYIYKKIGAISMEMGAHGDKQQLISHLEKQGFRVTQPLKEFGEYICVRK